MADDGLELGDVTIAFGDRVVLSDVRCAIRPGEAWALLGPNGSGKTSLLSVALGLRRPAGGVVRSRFRRVAWVPQAKSEAMRYIPVSVHDCMQMSFPDPRDHWWPSRRRNRNRRIAELLEQVGIGALERAAVRNCSAGELQRLLLARALILDPDFLVLDEPTASIDREGKSALLKLLDQLHRNRGLAILMTSHDSREQNGAQFPARAFHIEAGRLYTQSEREAAHE